MKKSFTRSLLVAALFLSSTFLFSQSGPGGQGKTDGSTNLSLWLRADAGVLNAGSTAAVNGETVATWQDQSGNGYHAIGINSPVFNASNAAFGSMPTITLVEGDDDYLSIEDDGDEAPELDNTDEISIFYVFNSDNSSGLRAHLSKRDGTNNAQSYVFYESGVINSRINSNTDGGATITGGTTYINSTTYQNGDFNHWLNQSSGGGNTGGTATIPNNNSDLNIGEFHHGDGRTFDGNFAEVIIFRQHLNNAERIAVETYLASKYGITLTNDFWDETTYSNYNTVDYTNEIAGIGQHSDATVASSATSGVLSISGGDDLANSEWIFWGHDGGDFATYAASEVPGSELRLAREWVINETGELGNVTVSFAASDIPSSGLISPDYYLLVDTDGDSDLSDATAYPMTLTGGNYEVDVNLNEGDVLAISYEAPMPAGVTGSLAFWFNSESGVENSGVAATDGQIVTTWQDISVNGADGQNGTAPTYYTSRMVNYHPVVHFDKASSEYLEFDLTGLESNIYSVFAVVQRTSSTGSQYIFGSEDNQTDAMALGYSSNTNLRLFNSSSDVVDATVPAYNSLTEGPAIAQFINTSGFFNETREYKDGTSNSNSGSASNYASTGYTGNIGGALGGNYFDGDILEIVAFTSHPSSEALVSNLAIKYGVDLGTDYEDELGATIWDISDNTGFESDVFAIGFDESFELDQRISKAATDSVVIATEADFTSLNNASSRASLSDGQYVFVSNDDDPFTFNQSHNGSPNIRLDRTWQIREVGSPGNIVVGVKSSAVDANVMIVSSDPTFSSGVTELSMATSGEYVYVEHDFSDGDYFTFVDDPSEVWYTYLSGNWSDPQNWTLDGAISALYVNPDSKIPAAGDSVVVKSGRIMTMDMNEVNVTKVELIGTLNLGSTFGHDFGYLEGSGTLRLSGNGGFDNYPTAIDTAFYDALEGGTVRYYGSSDIVLNQIRRYNNLVINMDNTAQLTTMIADSIYVYGDFTVQRGIFQLNDNTETEDLAILVEGNMIVEANGSFDVGTANARHELNLYGDFTNYGDVDFTNRTSQTTGSEATNGIVDFNLLSGIQDQMITLEGPTHFYRIEVNKGTDMTYVADIQAADPSYFELYGFANHDHGAVGQLTTNNNAVGLIIGTLKIGANVDLGPLNTGGNYNISEGAELWIDGGTAYKNGGTAIVPYGNLRVSSGTLEADINSGITSRANGTLYMEGGEVTIRQFRTSVFGATNQGGIVQTGGILNITGQTNGGINNNYCALNLTYTGNAFIMSGGVMNVSGANSKGGVFINSDTENILTGGTLNFISSNTNPFVISSRAGFFNLNLSKTSASGGNFVVMTNQTGPNGTDETIGDLPMEVLNDITLDNSDGNAVTLDMSGNNLEVQGSLNMDAGSAADFTDMTLIFDGAGSSSLNIGLATTLVLDSLQINKNEDQVITNIINGQSPAVQVDHYLDITRGNFDIGTFDVVANGSVNLADSVGTGLLSGVLTLSGSTAQTITSTSGAINNLTIDNANGVSLSGGLGVMGQLALNAGVFDIGTDRLTLTAEPTTSGAFSSTLMIQTEGNASDGGLRYYFDATADPASILYPIGTDANVGARYTPVNLDLNGVSDDGYVSFSIADTELATTNPAGSTTVLDYYWKLSHSGFTTRPDIEALDFTASELDDVDGSDGNGADDGTSLPDNWVTGKVENNEDSDDTPGTDTGFNALETPGSIVGYLATYTGNDTGTGVGFYTLSSANYTLGEATRFAVSPTIFYTRKTTNGDQTWNGASRWSITGTQGPPDAPRWPGQSGNSNDIVVIGAHDSDNHGFSQEPVRLDVNVNTNIAALLFEEAEAGESRGRLFPQSGTNHSWGEVSGNGEIQLFFTNSGNVPTFDEATTDFGGFFNVIESTWNLAHEGGAGTGNRVTMPSFPNEFPSLRVTATGGGNGGADGWGSQRQIEFANDIIVNNDLEVVNRAALYVQGNMDIADDVMIGVGFGHGRLRFPNGATSYTLNVGGGIYLGETTGGVIDENYIDVEPGNTNNVTHYLNVSEDIVLTENGNGSDPVLDLYRSATENQVELMLQGEGTHSLTNDSDVVPDFYRLILSKGTDTTNVFTVQSNFTLNGDNSTEPPALEIQGGKLVIDNAAINLEIANGIDYSIPEGAGLEVTQGTISMDGAVVVLDGLLKVNGGTVALTDTDIEYSNTGYALIEISSGSFEVGNIIRRAITTSTGILKYRQTGGTVLIASDNAPSYSPSRAAFEVSNPDSEFTLTGGSFTIQRGVTGNSNISLLLDPDTYDVTGSTITLGNANTPAYGATYFNIKSSIELNNLTIFDDADDNFPTVRLMSLPLVVNGTLDISSNAGLLANGFEVTVNGDFNNEGTYTNTSSTTTLGSETGQSVTGAGTFIIYNLTKTGAGEAQTNQDLVLNRNLRVEEGILNMQDFTISLKNDAYIQSTLSNSAVSNGLVFNGTANQDLYGVPNNTVTLGTVTIQNTSGVDIADGNGYNFDITDRLRLNGGVLNIGGSLLTVKRGGYVEAVSAFGENNMVQTNSSFTDNGFRQEFYTVAADTTVFFPVGELKYTPVAFDLGAGTTFGDIRVRPANEVHPSIVEDTEDEPNDKDIEDVNNALQYHWIVVARDLTNATGEATFYYDENDVAIDNDFDNDGFDEAPLWSESNYISARLLSNDTNWDKFDPSYFDASNDLFTVPLGAGVTSAEITGDYTAGVGTSDGVNQDIDGAIPDQLAQYESIGNGVYSSAANWNPLNGSPAVTDGVGPVGAQIFIRTGDLVTIDVSNIRLYSTEIESGGTLYVSPGTLSNRLGTVTGSGTIILDDTELLPTGEYSAFLLCDGGGLQYSGSTDYNVLSGISQIRNVTFDGTGERVMPNNAVDVCDVMTINGPDVTFDSGQTYNIGDDDSEADGLDLQAGSMVVSDGSVIDVTGDFTMSGGSLTGNAGTVLRVSDDITYSGGTLSWNNMDLVLDGTTEQIIDGDFTGISAIDDLTVNNSSSAGITIASGDIEIDGLLTLTDGLVNTTSTETLTILSNGSWTGASAASYVTGPMTKVNVPVSSTYIFPVGKAARYARVAVANVTTGGDTWTAEYFTSTNPTYPDTSFDSSDPGSGKNAITDVKSTDRWEVTSVGSNSAQVRLAYGPHNAFTDRDDIRVVWWDPVDMRWENRGAVTSGTVSSGTTQSEDFISFSTQQFALADAPEVPLPVDLVYFEARLESGDVRVTWQTASELNNDYFEVQRSKDGKNWEVIGTVDGAGDSDEVLDYSFLDANPYLGLSYYRLQQYDFDGVTEIFDAVAVDNTALRASIDLILKPNPTVPENINFELITGDDHTPIFMTMMDMSGKISFSKQIQPEGLSIEDRIIPIERLTAGLYFVQVVQGENAKVIKLILR